MDQKSDPRLALGYGSAWHLLRCIGWHREWFSDQVARAINAKSIRWLDFKPNKGGGSYFNGAPILDRELERVEFLDNASAYDSFWPKRGTQQNWDAIGRADINGVNEWLLVEAKANLAEINNHGTDAKEHGGRPMIRNSFIETLEALGHEHDSAVEWAEQWLSGYYQTANRLATLHFLTSQNIPARLLFIYFCGDHPSIRRKCPSKPEEWHVKIEEVKSKLGLKGTSALEKRVHHIFINVDAK